MNFFSGFSLQNEHELFSDFIDDTIYTIYGFSLGAIDAFEYAINQNERIDRVRLFSPAFFQNRDEKFKRVQTINYKKSQDKYEKEFLKNIAYPSSIDMKRYFRRDNISSLERLLNYIWQKDKIDKLLDRGVEIEVYLGGKDKIIDTKSAYEFFKEFATIYYIKEGGHILHG